MSTKNKNCTHPSYPQKHLYRQLIQKLDKFGHTLWCLTIVDLVPPKTNDESQGLTILETKSYQFKNWKI